jgi:hypothetical protein
MVKVIETESKMVVAEEWKEGEGMRKLVFDRV